VFVVSSITIESLGIRPILLTLLAAGVPNATILFPVWLQVVAILAPDTVPIVAGLIQTVAIPESSRSAW
jgi:hypothetical protein